MDEPDADRRHELDRRRRRRQFIRTHHPDAGGDPAAFVAGLAYFDQPASISDSTSSSSTTDRPAPRVFVVKHRPWPVVIVTGLGERIRRSRRPPRVR